MNKLLTLNGGTRMPQLGLGLMRFGDESATAGVMARAAAAGYRLFDTAAVYGNERQTGEGLRDLGLPRDELFITTKLWNDAQGPDAPRGALAASLEKLGLDHVDLYLIHWPLPMFDRYVETWRALITLRDEGKASAIGVSNFTVDQLERLVGETGVVPAVNQVEMHPYFQQRDLRAYHDRMGIVTQAWSPFGGGGTGAASLLADPVVIAIAARQGWTPSQVVLGWHLARGVSVIPKATSAEHLAQNMAATSLVLDAEDLARLDALDRADGRSGFDPMKMDIINFS